jgi:hypothetical protein
MRHLETEIDLYKDPNYHGESRIIKTFLLFPKTLPILSITGGSPCTTKCWRWLENAKIIQVYPYLGKYYQWTDICWEDIQEKENDS